MPFYDNFSQQPPTFIGQKLSSLEAQRILREILKDVVLQKGRFLELGPGRGWMAKAVKEKQPTLCYVGLDISLKMLKQLPSEHRVLSSVPPISFQSNLFDIVFASNLLEHMPTFREAFFLVEEMHRVARPGGIVALRVPNFFWWKEHFWNADYTHSFITTPRRIRQIFEDVGLKLKSTTACSGPWLGKKAYVPALLARLIPTAFIGHGEQATRIAKIIYSGKATFLLGTLVIGVKREAE